MDEDYKDYSQELDEKYEAHERELLERIYENIMKDFESLPESLKRDFNTLTDEERMNFIAEAVIERRKHISDSVMMERKIKPLFDFFLSSADLEIEVIGAFYIKSDMYQIVRNYTGETEKAHKVFDEILDRILKIYPTVNEITSRVSLYKDYIVPMQEKHKQFTLVTCVFFASLLSSYLKNDNEDGFLYQLLRKKIFNEKGFSAWKEEMNRHIHAIISSEAIDMVVSKQMERNKAKEYREKDKVKNLKTVYNINEKSKSVDEKYKELNVSIQKKAGIIKEVIKDYMYNYYDDITDLHQYHYFEDLLKITHSILSDESQGYNQRETETKYKEISIILNSLLPSAMYDKINEHQNRISTIHDDLSQYFSS